MECFKFEQVVSLFFWDKCTNKEKKQSNREIYTFRYLNSVQSNECISLKIMYFS